MFWIITTLLFKIYTKKRTGTQGLTFKIPATVNCDCGYMCLFVYLYCCHWRKYSIASRWRDNNISVSIWKISIFLVFMYCVFAVYKFFFLVFVETQFDEFTIPQRDIILVPKVRCMLCCFFCHKSEKKTFEYIFFCLDFDFWCGYCVCR